MASFCHVGTVLTGQQGTASRQQGAAMSLEEVGSEVLCVMKKMLPQCRFEQVELIVMLGTGRHATCLGIYQHLGLSGDC